MTLPHLFQTAAKSRPKTHVAVKFKEGSAWKEWNWEDYYSQVCRIAGYLKSIGINKNDRVGIFAETCKEWACTDLAVLGLGAVTVPVYSNGTPEELEHIVKDSGMKVLFVGGQPQLEKWQSVQKNCPEVRQTIVFEGDFGLPVWSKLTALQIESVYPAEIGLSDLASIVYTSGTSGLPKGVAITHQQIISEVDDIQKTFNVDHNDSTLSFLPYAHVLGRVEMWLSIYSGFTLCLAQSIDRIKSNLMEVQPTAMIAVPRIFEKFFAAINSEVSQRKLLFSVLGVCRKISPEWTNWLTGRLLSSVVQKAFGSRFRFAISGGAPLDIEIASFFKAAGVPVFEGYGLTESTGAIAVNSPSHARYGTVGRPLPEVSIRIAEDGEILVRSKKIMAGYFSNGQFTPRDHDEYFPTGDIGELDKDGFLKITDRKKDLIKTSGGKYVAPQKLENMLKRNGLVSNALIHGEHRKYITALITINASEARKWAKSRALSFSTDEELAQSKELKAEMDSWVSEINKELASFESIKKIAILPRDFSVEAGELTPSLKLKRKFCDEKYREVLDGLY